MDTKTAPIARGWAVVDTNDSKIGEVTDVREDHIVVSAGTFGKHDLYIPTDHLTPRETGTVGVSVPGDLVEQQGWRYPPSSSHEHEPPAYPEVPDTTMIETSGYGAGRLAAPEPQGAIRDDGFIDPEEVPHADIEPDEETPGAPEDERRD